MWQKIRSRILGRGILLVISIYGQCNAATGARNGGIIKKQQGNNIIIQLANSKREGMNLIGYG